MSSWDYENIKKGGFSDDQRAEINAGINAGVDVSVYAKKEFLSIQMRQIRLGLEAEVDVKKYADEAYDWFQMEEIRLGLEEGLIVEGYASPEIPYNSMRQIRLGLKEGIDLSEYRTLPAGVIQEIRKASMAKVDILEYVREGFDTEQLEQIRISIEKGTDVKPYLDKDFRGASIREIVRGLEKGLDVSCYAKMDYSWQQMRQIRYGLERRLDISQYVSALYGWQQMKEIRKGLEEGIDVSSYRSMVFTATDMRKKRMALLEQAELEGRGNRPVLEHDDAAPQCLHDLDISISEDEMEAYIRLRQPGQMVTQEDIELALKSRGILKGIIGEEVERLSAGRDVGQSVLIARGIPPRNGADGWYEFFFPTDLKKNPAVLEDGSIDYRHVQWFESVKKGQKIACYHEAGPGEVGYTVTGRRLKPKRGRERSMLAGRGFLLKEDRKTYLAAKDGIAELKSGRLEVANLFVFDSITASDGRLEFDGTVYVKGRVEDGAKIEASGDVVVDGPVGDATIASRRSVLLRQGVCAAGQGSVCAEKDIMGKSFENVRINAGGNLQSGYCLDCRIYVGGRVIVSGEDGFVAGGEIHVARGLETVHLGNRAGVDTMLQIGVTDQFTEEWTALRKQIQNVREELETFHDAQFDLQNKYLAEIRNSMKLYLKIEDAIYNKEIEFSRLMKKRAEMKKEQQAIGNAVAVITGRLYEGVTVFMEDQSLVSVPMENVIIRMRGKEIEVCGKEYTGGENYAEQGAGG